MRNPVVTARVGLWPRSVHDTPPWREWAFGRAPWLPVVVGAVVVVAAVVVVVSLFPGPLVPLSLVFLVPLVFPAGTFPVLCYSRGALLVFW